MTDDVKHFLGILLFCILVKIRVSHGNVGAQSAESFEPVFTKPISDAGDDIILGAKPSKTLKEIFPNIGTSIECNRLDNTKNYRDEFQTKVQNRTRNSFEVSTNEPTQEVHIFKYFLQFREDVWICRKRPSGIQMKSDKDWFYKIINGLRNKILLRSIRYYSGIEVSMIDCGHDTGECVKVIETKCLAEENNKFIQFQCEQWKDNPPSFSDIAFLENALFSLKPLPVPKTDGYYKYEWATDVFTSWEICKEGERSFKIGSAPSTHIVQEINCGAPLMAKGKFFPEIHQLIDIGMGQEKYALLSIEKFFGMFDIVDKHVQVCVTKSEKIIYRVKHTIVGRVAVKNIEYGRGIAELYSTILEGEKRSITYTEIKYFDATTREPINDEIHYKETREISRKPSNYKINKSDHGYDILYKLLPGRIFNTFVSPHGYNLRVGSEPIYDMNKGNNIIMTCTQSEYLDAYRTEIKISTHDYGDNYPDFGRSMYFILPTDDERITTEYISQEAWLCESNDNKVSKEDKLMMRIVNRLKFSVSVHMIESYDGIEIMLKPHSSDGESTYVEIFEVKYLNNGRATRFGGTIKFTSAIETAFSVSQNRYTLSKIEIYPRPINEVPRWEYNRKDYYWDGSKYEEFIIAQGRRETMNITVPVEYKITYEMLPSIFVCGMMDDNKKEFPNYFSISIEGAKVADSVINSEYQSTYFQENTVQKYKCYSKMLVGDPPGILVLYRVMTHQELDKTALNRITAIRHSSMDKVWFEMPYKEDEFELRLEQIRFYTLSGAVVHFDSYLIYHDVYRLGVWRSGTESFGEKYVESKLNYNLFDWSSDKITQSANLDAKGSTIEVLSTIHDKLIESNEVVTCSKFEDFPFVKYNDYQTIIQKLPPSKSTSSETQQEEELFEYKSQEVWQCRDSTKKIIFKRIVNKLITTKTDVRVHHPDGVQVGTLILPSQEKCIQITQVKFVKEEGNTFKHIQYVGKLRLVTGVLIGAEKFITTTNLYKVPGKIYETATEGLQGTLESMRMYAHLKLDCIETEKIEDVAFIETLDTELVNVKGDRLYQIGRAWDDKTAIRRGDLTCLPLWEPNSILYIPWAAQYVDRALHLLTESEFLMDFEILETNVWLCTNKIEELLKVQIRYKTNLKHVFSVRFQGRVQLKYPDKITIENNPGINYLEISETVYMDVMASKVFRHDGKLVLEKIEKKTEDKSEEKEKKGGFWRRFIPCK